MHSNSNPGDDALDADAPVDLASMAAIMREQRRATRVPDATSIATMLATWGIVWCLGFLSLWSGEYGGNPWFRLPGPSAWIVFGALVATGIVISIVLGVRMGRGVRGASAKAGALYGWSWPIVMIGAWLMLMGLIRNGLTPELTGLVAPALFVFAAGAMYLVGGALWRSGTSFALGCTIIATAAIATIVGEPHHYVVYAIGSLTLFVFAWRMRRDLLAEGERAASGRRTNRGR